MKVHRGLPPSSIGQDRLSELRDQGWDSELLLMRLALIEHEGLRKDIAKMRGKGRVYPEILPTQASGRWSTKNPNLPGFAREFWAKHSDIVYPDPGEWWLDWDWMGIEARMFTAYSGDEEDVELFRRGDPDIHTFTCVKYLMAWQPDLQIGDPLQLPDDWTGSKDERRTRAKNFRYGVLQYGTSAKAILGMPGIEKLGLDRFSLLQRAEKFLAARPKSVAFKHRTFEECIHDKVALTFMGRRRLLFGEPDQRAKEGLNHKIQGAVADLLNWCLVQIDRQWPQSSLILNKHDGAIQAFPKLLASNVIMPKVKALVEREWEVGPGTVMRFPADWHEFQG